MRTHHNGSTRNFGVQKVIMFRVDLERRFLKRQDGTWTVPVICEGSEGAKVESAIRLVTGLTPGHDEFWSQANILCRDLRGAGYFLGKDREEWIVLRQYDQPLRALFETW